MTVSGNDNFEEYDEESVDLFDDFEPSDSVDDFVYSDDSFIVNFQNLDSEYVSHSFSSEDLRSDRIEMESSVLVSDRASSSVDYSGYLENISTLLIFILVAIIGFGLSVSFILGVKK